MENLSSIPGLLAWLFAIDTIGVPWDVVGCTQETGGVERASFTLFLHVASTRAETCKAWLGRLVQIVVCLTNSDIVN